jgi:hypothetical protein
MTWYQLWCWGWDFLNTNFSAAGFGAIGGAFGAQWLGNRTAKRQALVEELRSTNAAINVAYTIANTYFNLKRQHAKPMKERFDALNASREKFQRDRADGAIPRDQVFEFQADFETLTPPDVPIDILKGLMFEKVSLIGRPLSFVVFLEQSIGDLNSTIKARNSVIEGCQARSPIPVEELVPLHFGLKDAHGRIDRRYTSSLENMVTKVDDCLFLSTRIVADLEAHGLELKKALGGKGRVTTLDFSKAKEQGLFPDEANYKDWASLPNPTAKD